VGVATHTAGRRASLSKGLRLSPGVVNSPRSPCKGDNLVRSPYYQELTKGKMSGRS